MVCNPWYIMKKLNYISVCEGKKLHSGFQRAGGWCKPVNRLYILSVPESLY